VASGSRQHRRSGSAYEQVRNSIFVSQGEGTFTPAFASSMRQCIFCSVLWQQQHRTRDCVGWRDQLPPAPDGPHAPGGEEAVVKFVSQQLKRAGGVHLLLWTSATAGSPSLLLCLSSAGMA